MADLCIFGHNVSLPGHTEVRVLLNGKEVNAGVVRYADMAAADVSRKMGGDCAMIEFFMVPARQF